MIITKKQARRFILMKQGLFGERRFEGKDGIMGFIGQAGCVQYDPIDICGKNHELVLQSRVKNFRKPQLSELLYDDRVLVDYYDKMMSIFPVDDWPYFHGTREHYRNHGWGRRHIGEIAEDILDLIRNSGPVCSSDLEHQETVDWHWGPTKLARVALESLYLQGDLIIHHKKNTRKFYDLAERHIPLEILNSGNPFSNDDKRLEWHLLRRIESVGLMWDKAGDALYLGVSNINQKTRIRTFSALYEKGLIQKVSVDGCGYDFYYSASDEEYMQRALTGEKASNRVEFIAPLDNMMWDRKLIRELFGFDYKWEIYTPAKDRKFGYYVLPVLFREDLVGRIEIVRNKKDGCMEVKNLWLEPSARDTKLLRNSISRRLLKFSKTML